MNDRELIDEIFAELRPTGESLGHYKDVKQALLQMLKKARVEAVSNLKIAKLNLETFTTDHADGYQMAVEDMNRNIDKRIAELTQDTNTPKEGAE
jgi:hypothetical protein